MRGLLFKGQPAGENFLQLARRGAENAEKKK